MLVVELVVEEPAVGVLVAFELLPELLDPALGGFTLKMKAGDWVMRLAFPDESV